MSVRFWHIFAKITGWPIKQVVFRTKILYEDREVQSRKIKGAAIVICNHTSVFDFALLLFVFFGRTLRCQMAELLFRKKPLGWLLRRLGGIRVDRTGHDFGFLRTSEDILRRGGVVLIFPESRLPLSQEARPLPFKPSAAYLALATGVPVIPVYTNGQYFNLRRRAAVIIGKPIDPREYADEGLTERERIERLSCAMRERVIELGKLLDERYGKKK